MSYPREQASRGLLLLFVSAIISLFSWLPFIGIVAFGLNLYALYTLSTAAEGYRTAFYVNIVGIILSVVGMVFKNGFLGALVDMAIQILNFLSVYFICKTTGDFLSTVDYRLAGSGTTVWVLYAVCTGVMILCELLSVIPIINIGAALLSAGIAVVQFVAGILYLIFLFRSQKALA